MFYIFELENTAYYFYGSERSTANQITEYNIIIMSSL